MLTNFNNIRFKYLRSHVYALFAIAIVLLTLLLTIDFFYDPEWLTIRGITFFILLYVGIGLILSVYIAFKASSDLKERIDYLSVQIAQYANGNYQSRIYMDEKDEISRISEDLNSLGEKLQTQVKSLQKLADERAEYAKAAYRTATIEERQRLARDLHDSVSQQLFALTMLAEAAVNEVERSPERSKKLLQEVANAGLIAQKEMRALLLHLRPVYLSGDSLEQGIEKLIQEMKQHATLEISFEMAEELSLPEVIEEQIFRIIQEALSNILRHAEAETTSIRISEQQKELFLHIRDDGKGFEQEDLNHKKTSYGIQTMKERVEQLGGNFQIRSRKDRGTYIDIRIPL